MDGQTSNRTINTKHFAQKPPRETTNPKNQANKHPCTPSTNMLVLFQSMNWLGTGKVASNISEEKEGDAGDSEEDTEESEQALEVRSCPNDRVGHARARA